MKKSSDFSYFLVLASWEFSLIVDSLFVFKIFSRHESVKKLILLVWLFE